jgi:hypothetical protein
MRKYGWEAHVVEDDPSSPNGMNYHTHGLREKYGHADIQCVLRIPPQKIHDVVWGIVREIEQGRVFEAGKRYDHVLADMDVTFVEATECERKVLRLILPDAKGELDEARMTPEYAEQYATTRCGKPSNLSGSTTRRWEGW